MIKIMQLYFLFLRKKNYCNPNLFLIHLSGTKHFKHFNMEYKTIKFEVDGNIGILTMNRPQAMNALNLEVYAELNNLLTTIESMKDLCVLIITGEGKAFVAGADIAEMSDMNSEQGQKFSKTGHDTMSRISNLSIPVIAAVNGFALGGGCEFAMCCDFRIASNFAKFGQPEVNLGLIPGFAGTVRLPRLIGLADALYYLVTADMFDANEALRLGMVQKVVPAEELMNEVKKIAAKIASKGPKSVRKVKEVTLNGFFKDFDKASEVEWVEFGKLFGNGESGEGMKAFLEKRKPNW